jgi:hypothetical protein
LIWAPQVAATESNTLIRTPQVAVTESNTLIRIFHPAKLLKIIYHGKNQSYSLLLPPR